MMLSSNRRRRFFTVLGIVPVVACGLLVNTPAVQARPSSTRTSPDLGTPVAGSLWHASTPKTPTAAPTSPSAVHLQNDHWSIALASGMPAVAVNTTAVDPNAVSATVSGPWSTVGPNGLAIAAATAIREARTATPNTPVSVSLTANATYASTGAAPFTLTLSRTGSAAEPVAVKVPFALLDGLYGAGYSARVYWTATSSPGPREHSTVQVATRRDAKLRQFILTPAVGATAVTIRPMAQVSAADGSGSFGATPLNAAASWDVATQTGAFSWQYPMRVPPSAAGPSPSVGLSYDSQAVDGATASSNNQPSAVGEGWQLSGGRFISRSYIGCSQDDTPIATSGDLCWRSSNATVSFAGHSGLLVPVAGSDPAQINEWRLQVDDGSRFRHLIGADNGVRAGEYWEMTTRDGTRYYFGQNKLPGFVSTSTPTNSTWNVPVYGNDAGEPCHGATFDVSSCQQAWRWNLDYVVDVCPAPGSVEGL